MTKTEALALIDEHKNKLTNPVEMLHWVWLRVTILKISDEAWVMASGEAATSLSN